MHFNTDKCKVTSRNRGRILPLYTALVKLILEFCPYSSGIHNLKNNVESLKRVQKGAQKMIQGLEKMPHNEILKELNLLSLSKKD